ncbi:MAG: ABC transporter permease [Chloroflexi bacterium]|nr:ABC transporter permease [Chloroflexota bacterium]MDL1883276.1 ABC transporter permease [Anaerolineae bacterium CFX8]
MSTKRILTLARRVIQQLAADRRTVALILIVPLVVMTVAGILIRAESSPISIGIVMNDEGAVIPLGSRAVNLGQNLSDNLGGLNDSFRVEVMDAETARARLDAGDLDAVISLPADFSAQAVQTRELNIPVEYEGSNPMTARLLEGMLTRAAVQTLAGLTLIGGLDLTTPPVHLQATYRYGSADFDTMDYLAPVFIGLFVFLFVFILTSVAFLRERSAGTLERLQATPIRRAEIVTGYMLGFALFALAQSLIILGYTIWGLNVHYTGSLAVIFVVEFLLALMAVNLGIFFSTFARNEFQVVQFIPLVIVTQILLSGALWPIKDMPAWLQPVAWLMPLTHANRALRDVMIKGFDLAQIAPFVLALAAFAAVFVALAAQTVRRGAGA